MSKGFYAKLAFENLKKNKKTYLPFMITSMMTTMMLYMIIALSDNPQMNKMIGGAEIAMMLGLGVVIVELFAIIFLFYTNSFLLKRRKREFGVLTVLGMEKKHLARVVFYELFYVLAASLALGLLFGILFDKLFYLLIIKMIGTEVPLGFYISKRGLIETATYIGVIYGLMWLYSVVQIQTSKPIDLINADKVSEKEPKSKWVLAIAGLICLAIGYGLSLSITNPVEAMVLFFVAVVFVIIGTYLIFTTGSITLLKLLEKNKHFYYKTSHFLSVSNMKFRMKQNAVSLANICILSTMVLVMLSSTLSLWTGMVDSVNSMLKRDETITVRFDQIEQTPLIEEAVQRSIQESGLDPQEAERFVSYATDFKKEGNRFIVQPGHMAEFYIEFIPLSAFNEAEKTDLYLGQDECYVYSKKGSLDAKEIEVDSIPLRIKGILHETSLYSSTDTYINDTHTLIVPDAQFEEIRSHIIETYAKVGIEYAPSFEYREQFNVAEGKVDETVLDEALHKNLEPIDVLTYYARNFDEIMLSFRSLYAGFFFIGIFLSILFIMATILIMYYKQISEGYEDEKRYDIMQKVGLDQKQIQGTIKTQVLIVFFLPLIVAGIHIVFAFPMVSRMLRILSLTNTNLFIWTTIGCFAAFSLLYILIYSITAKVYYDIVTKRP
ncbi:ABC transporter permease [Dubosiella newyorkensis]|uniref:ABC transporter permease n=2 Tax=Dubosiella newyorkensis TaxID=1862672 RepID=UPI002729A373|nr:FtsX-like permease family protein [Dubosiella newyorkensis]